MNQDSWDETILSLAPKTLPPLSAPLPTNPYECAKAVYYLFDTTRNGAGTDWSAYLKTRVAADKQMRLVAPSGISGEGGQRYLEVVRDAVYDVLKGALSQGQWEKVARGVVVTDLDVEIDRNGGYGISHSIIVTRIHSPVSVSSLDLRFMYTLRQEWDSITWEYALGMRLNPTPRSPQMPRSREPCPISRMNCTDGWKPLAWFFTDEPEDDEEAEWDAGSAAEEEEHSQFSMKPSDLSAAHDLLFGPDKKLAQRVSKKDTLRLLLAAIGMPFHIASRKGERDGYVGVYDAVEFQLGEQKPGISAAGLRRVLRVPALAGGSAA